MRLGDDVASRAVDDVGIEGIGRHVPVLDHADRMPVAVRDLTVIAAARDAYRAALLLAGADAVREGGRDADVIELRRRLVVPGAPGRPAVDGDECTLIADERDVVRVDGTHPQVLVVVAARRAAPRAPVRAAVGGLHRDDGGAVDHVGVRRVDF